MGFLHLFTYHQTILKMHFFSFAPENSRNLLMICSAFFLQVQHLDIFLKHFLILSLNYTAQLAFYWVCTVLSNANICTLQSLTLQVRWWHHLSGKAFWLPNIGSVLMMWCLKGMFLMHLTSKSVESQELLWYLSISKLTHWHLQNTLTNRTHILFHGHDIFL